MGFFDRMFGRSEGGGESPQGGDFTAALSMHVRGEAAAALEAYRRLAAHDPEQVLPAFFAAVATGSSGETAAAAEELRSLSGRIAAAGDTISRVVSVQLGDLLQAEPFLSAPAVAELIVSFGDALKKEGLLREAAVCFEIAAGLDKENANVLHRLGDTLHDLRMYDYAESVLLEALRHAPNHWGALYTHAVLLQDVGRIPEAIEAYGKAVRLNPDHPRCRNNYGAALLRADRLEEALEQCTRAAELDPTFPLALVNLGYIHLRMG
ncbi:MAG TPA: tetratricopeptide repeat protein, partial [Verrucomicrobiae bacterium]|nr:tetratricopeptide repeat protein [Verrucomicrobiae bacterium]